MNFRRLLLLCAASPSIALAQISPGDLSRAHEGLEGIDQCTHCHTLGKSVSNDRCLACHAEIQTRLSAGRGLHARTPDRPCASCHSEHHGRDFAIVRLNRSSFDHAAAGFPLNGLHTGLSCDSCHSTGRIQDADVRQLMGKRPGTLLGLSTRCGTCHEDAHRGQFTADCAGCHTEAAWKPAARFTHDRTRFPLTGMHAGIECRLCHRTTIPGTGTLRYRGVASASCRDCHADPHHGSFRQTCASCHETTGWHLVRGTAFDHAQTRFPLRGSHAQLRCGKCHAFSPAQRNAGGEQGFHITRFGTCDRCHADAHAGQFAARADSGRCEACHTEQGFRRVTYSIDEHDRTGFPLTGAHRATPCTACHTAGAVQAASTRKFRWETPLYCPSCHRDAHQGQFKERPCQSCHTTAAWRSLAFDHATTGFPLEGKHRALGCDRCHTPAPVVRYAGTPAACARCHDDVHAGQFARQGATACERCHIPAGWLEIRLDHNTQTGFPLTGAHASVACRKCHPVETVNGKQVARYRIPGRACEDCHTAGPERAR